MSRHRRSWTSLNMKTRVIRARLAEPVPLPHEPPHRRSIPSKSKYGFDRVGEGDGYAPNKVPPHGPGNRRVPMTLPTVNLPPAYEEDEE